MRTKTLCVSERNLMFVVGGQLFDQAPNRQPRQAEIIMQKVRDAFRKDAYDDNCWYSLEIPKKYLYKYIKTLLMDIPEFVDLNLSQKEVDENISVDDESRPKYTFVTRYDKHDYESWKTDFIDLDAFISNVHGRLLWVLESDQDCFLCVHEKTDLCNSCSVNPSFHYHYESSRMPKGKYTFSCKFNCYAHKQICCSECDKQYDCVGKCDGHPDTCGATTGVGDSV